MKNYILAFLVLLVLNAQAQDGATGIRKLLEQQTKAWNKGDIEGFMQTYWKSDSLLFIGKSGITKGWNQTLANYKKAYPGKEAMGTLTFDIIKITMLTPADSFVVGKWTLTRMAGNLSGHYTLLLKKIKGEWKIIADHSS